MRETGSGCHLDHRLRPVRQRERCRCLPFLISPGRETVIDVKAQLFLRERVKKLGLAPLTSMFFHAEDTDRFMDDFRPEVHDSDGLLIVNGNGERVWRPLVNPKGLRISAFHAENPKAFGLLQRDRDFRSYQDLEASYQSRPSALVEPIGDWGKGVVELVQIPSDSERVRQYRGVLGSGPCRPWPTGSSSMPIGCALVPTSSPN